MLVQVLPDLSLSLQDFRSSELIALVDTSTYVTVPDASHLSLQVTVPGYPTINVAFTPQNVNIYKAIDLGIPTSNTGCTSLPDGIYNVIYTINPPTGNGGMINQNFIKIDQIKCKYQHAYLKINIECACGEHSQDKYIKELKRIKLYIDGSVGACNEGNYVRSQELYSKAFFMLNNICCKFKSINFNNCNQGGWGGNLIGCGCK